MRKTAQLTQLHIGEGLTHLSGEMLKTTQHFLKGPRITFWSRHIMIPAVSNLSSDTSKAKLKDFAASLGLKPTVL